MVSNFKLILMKSILVILTIILGLQVKIISLKKQKQLEYEKKIDINKNKKEESENIGILDILELENDFNISKLENYGLNFWDGYINFDESLEEGIKKVEYLLKKDFTIENYNVEYKDGYGNFNLKVRVGD